MTDSAILHQAHNYTVLCYGAVYSIVAIEVIMTSFIFKFLGGSGGGEFQFPPPLYETFQISSSEKC